MAIKDALGSAAKKVKGAYKSGGDETTGLGKELQEKARLTKAAGDSLKPPSEPEKTVGKPSPMKPAQGPYGTGPGEKRIDTSYPGSQMPKMHKGGIVKKTGPHVLLKGEAVLSKKDTKKVSALGGQPSSAPPDAPDGMSIDKVDDGSFHIQHRYNGSEKDGSIPKSGKYTARNVKHLVRHIKRHFGGGQENEGMAEPSSFAEGGVVEKSGLAKVHAGETVIPAPVKNPDVYLGGNKPKAAPAKPVKKYQATPADRERITESTGVV